MTKQTIVAPLNNMMRIEPEVIAYCEKHGWKNPSLDQMTNCWKAIAPNSIDQKPELLPMTYYQVWENFESDRGTNRYILYLGDCFGNKIEDSRAKNIATARLVAYAKAKRFAVFISDLQFS